MRDASDDPMSYDKLLETVRAAGSLLGNAHSRLSQCHREKLAADSNREVMELVKSGFDFSRASLIYSV